METRWYHLVAWIFGGAFLTNAVPHMVSGVSGSPLQTPLASPPGVGMSSSTVNVLWGMFNLVVGYVLVVRVGRFDLRQTKHAVVLGLGVLAMALLLAHQLGKLHGGNF
jgi:ABC-type tungstate transport system substrate-binding protein